MSAAIAPAAVEPWWEANQRDLVGHLDRVRGLLEGEAVILDLCDGSTPFVLKRDELVEYRKFEPSL